VNDGLCVDMATGNFLDVNQKWLEMTGFTVEEARGLNVGAFARPGNLPGRRLPARQAAAGGPQLFEWLAQTKMAAHCGG
jgi:PAS domain S-box-containing protein